MRRSIVLTKLGLLFIGVATALDPFMNTGDTTTTPATTSTATTTTQAPQNNAPTNPTPASAPHPEPQLTQAQADLIVLLHESAHHLEESIVLFNTTLDAMINATVKAGSGPPASRPKRSVARNDISIRQVISASEIEIYRTGLKSIAAGDSLQHMVVPRTVFSLLSRTKRDAAGPLPPGVPAGEEHPDTPESHLSFMTKVLALMTDNVKQMEELVRMFNYTVYKTSAAGGGRVKRDFSGLMPEELALMRDPYSNSKNFDDSLYALKCPLEREKENVRRGYMDAFAEMGFLPDGTRPQAPTAAPLATTVPPPPPPPKEEEPDNKPDRFRDTERRSQRGHDDDGGRRSDTNDDKENKNPEPSSSSRRRGGDGSRGSHDETRRRTNKEDDYSGRRAGSKGDPGARNQDSDRRNSSNNRMNRPGSPSDRRDHGDEGARSGNHQPGRRRNEQDSSSPRKHYRLNSEQDSSGGPRRTDDERRENERRRGDDRKWK